MANKILRKLGMGMSIMMMSSQLSGMSVLAAPGGEFGDLLEDTYEEQEENQEESEIEDFDIEEEDTERLEGTKDLVPPTSIEWDGPGWIKFWVSDVPMYYEGNIYKDGKAGGTYHFGDLSKKNANSYARWFVGQEFRGSGTYSFLLGVKEDETKNYAYYSEVKPEIEWTEPETRLNTPTNLRWEKTDDEKFAIAVCDPVVNAGAYSFAIYEDGNRIFGAKRYEVDYAVDCSSIISNPSEHNYTFTVEVWSDDLVNYAHSYVSDSSPVFDPENTKPFNNSKEEDGIAINEQNFPDETFRNYVTENFDTVKDGVLSDEEIGQIQLINVSGKDITTLKGIELFPQLLRLA